MITIPVLAESELPQHPAPDDVVIVWRPAYGRHEALVCDIPGQWAFLAMGTIDECQKAAEDFLA